MLERSWPWVADLASAPLRVEHENGRTPEEGDIWLNPELDEVGGL